MDHPTNLMTTVCFLELEEIPDYQTIADIITKRWLAHESFRNRIQENVSKKLIWEIDPDFDIRSHLYRVGLPSPYNEGALRELIENYKGGAVILARIHNCLSAYTNLHQALLSLSDGENKTVDKNSFGGHGPLWSSIPILNAGKHLIDKFDSIQRFSEKWINSVIDTFSNPLHLVENAMNHTGIAVETSAALAKLALLPPDSEVLFKGRLGVQKKVVCSDPLSLEKIRTTGEFFGATADEILFTIITGTLREYLIEHDQALEDDICVAIPVHYFQREAKEEETPHILFLQLPIHIEDPIYQLKEIQRNLENLPDLPDISSGLQAMNALKIPSAIIAKTGISFLGDRVASVLINIPGPQRPRYFAGKRIANFLLWEPNVSGSGINLSIVAYNGKVTLGVIADAELIPDVELIPKIFEKKFLHLTRMNQIKKKPISLKSVPSSIPIPRSSHS